MTKPEIQAGQRSRTMRRWLYPVTLLAAAVLLWRWSGRQSHGDIERIEVLVRDSLLDVCEGRSIADRLPAAADAADAFMLDALRSLCDGGFEANADPITVRRTDGPGLHSFEAIVRGDGATLVLSLRHDKPDADILIVGVSTQE